MSQERPRPESVKRSDGNDVVIDTQPELTLISAWLLKQLKTQETLDQLQSQDTGTVTQEQVTDLLRQAMSLADSAPNSSFRQEACKLVTQIKILVRNE